MKEQSSVVNYPLYSPLGTLTVAWSEQGDEWMHRLGDALKQFDTELAVTGQRYDDSTSPFIQLTASRGAEQVDGHLLIAPLASGDRVQLFIGWNGEPSDHIGRAWAGAAQTAVDSLGHDDPLHDWTALIGPPTIRTNGDEVHLAAEGRVGPFALSPANRPMCEGAFPTLTPSLSGCTPLASLPILVRGSHPGYSWKAASLLAARELNMLCHMLSVVWGSALVVRESLAPLNQGVRTVPEKIFWQNLMDDEPITIRKEHGRELPSWIEHAWNLARTKPRLKHALAAHHEGLLLHTKHPSLALVAHIAAIEAVSQMIFREDRCSECRAHLDVSAKFRSTLRLVLDDATAEQLGNAYSPRSSTVHQGRLHGVETTNGAFGWGMWSPDDATDFQWQTVSGMASAGRKLLNMALQGSLPQKSVFIGSDV